MQSIFHFTDSICQFALDKHPNDEFDYKNGVKMFYVTYYAEKCNKAICDTEYAKGELSNSNVTSII